MQNKEKYRLYVDLTNVPRLKPSNRNKCYQKSMTSMKSAYLVLYGSFHQVGASFMIGVPCYVGKCTIYYHSL